MSQADIELAYKVFPNPRAFVLRLGERIFKEREMLEDLHDTVVMQLEGAASPFWLLRRLIMAVGAYRIFRDFANDLAALGAEKTRRDGPLSNLPWSRCGCISM